MESINKYIDLLVSPTETLQSSYGQMVVDKYILLEYGLSQLDSVVSLKSDFKIQFLIDPIYFQKYELQLSQDFPTQEICSNSQLKLKEIIECSETELNRKLLIESNFLYLLHRLRLGVEPTDDCGTCQFLLEPLHQESIMSAKNFIHQNLSQKISIPTLAREAGTNQCYLKKGFKEMYGSSIGEYIQEHRMIKSKHLLENTEKSIAEIATEVGYSSASSYSQAFKNYFGVTPRSFTSNQK